MGPGTKLRQPLTQLTGDTGHGELHKGLQGLLSTHRTQFRLCVAWRDCSGDELG